MPSGYSNKTGLGSVKGKHWTTGPMSKERKEAHRTRMNNFLKSARGYGYRKRMSVIFKGKSRPDLSEIRTGHKATQETKSKMSLAHKGKKTGFDSIAIVDKRIKDEMVELEKQGFRCMPVGGKVRPDIIGIKDGKVYAIEVEYKKSPDYSKYDGENRKYFDDVIWINKHKYPRPNPSN